MKNKLKLIFLLLACQIMSGVAFAQSESCSPCTKPVILASRDSCTPTPVATPSPTSTRTPTATVCVPPTLSLSVNSVNIPATINVDGNYAGTYTASGNALLNINSSTGSQIQISGGNEVSLAGSTINFQSSGVATRTVNSNNRSSGQCTNREPICAKPCNFGGCIDCNCSLRAASGGHMYGWTDIYRYSVNFSKNYTVTAINNCGSTSANFTIAVKGDKQANKYFEQWGVSPISLNLTGKALNLKEQKFTKVNFKLSEGSLNNVYWLASAETPLLVWDPEKTGKIKDGTQLFGSWSFGKKWETGYEALASLDNNKDGFLKNDELKGIRLWADADKDGVSQDSEVQDLDLIGISAISVKFNRQDHLPIHGIISYISDKGFEYTQNGSSVWAESFDWIVPEGDEQAAFKEELKRAEDQGYLVREWKEENLEMMGNRSYGYLMVKRDSGDLLSGYHIRATRSDKLPYEYSLSSSPVSGIWSDNSFEFTYSNDDSAGLMKETIKAYAKVINSEIVPDRLEIIHSQGPGSEMKREAKWLLLPAEKPFN